MSYKKISLQKSREFGVVIGALILSVSMVIFFRREFFPFTLFLGGSLLVLLGLMAPKLLKPFTYIWLKFGMLLNKITTPLIMLLFFFTAFFPYSIILKLFGVNFIPLGESANWKKIEQQKIDVDYFKRQF